MKYLLLDIRLGWNKIRMKYLGPFYQSFDQKKMKKHEIFHIEPFWSFMDSDFFYKKSLKSIY